MKRNSTISDYDAISALVFDGDNHIGSACLLWSENKQNLYCITAYHCTFNNNRNVDIHIKQNIQGELIEHKIIGDRMSDSLNDIAIYELEYSKSFDTIPFTLTSDLLTPPSNCYISGYPQKNLTTRSTIPAVFICKNDIDRIELNLPDLDIDGINRYDEIVGISGSGCYEVIGGIIKFFGIENKALNRDIPFREVYCVSLSTINQILINEKKPELPKATPSYISQKIGGYSSVIEVLKKFSFSNVWTSIGITESIIKNVQNHFSKNTDGALFICGSSGIGKTRSVLMACKKKEFANVLYYESFSIFKEDLIELQQYTLETNEVLNIIVDEAQLKDWNYVNNELFDWFHLFRIILIGTISKNKYNNAKDYIYVSTCNENDVKKVVEAQYPLFTPEEVQGIYKLSYNDLRLAMLISRLHNMDKQQIISTNIMSGRATQLYDRYSSAKDILVRTIKHKKWDVPNNIDLNHYFERLSLFVDIGFKGRAVDEIEALSEFFNEDKCEFKRAVDHLADVELGIKKEDYFELCPRALAKLSFEESGWDIIRYKIDEFMEFIPNDLMRRRFFDRVDECSMSKEVNEALSAWFCKKYYTIDLNLLNYSNVNEVMMFVEHNPQIGLKWLKTIVNNATDTDVQSFGNIINTSRRHVVWTCEHLANFNECFFDCEEILFKLAENECEGGISNNSQGVWSSYFSIYLANTEVSFYLRYDILIRRAVECKEKRHEAVFKKAFSTVFVEGNIRWLPPKMIGGVMTPPNWEPKTIGDMIEAKRYSLIKLQTSFGALESFMKELIIETISENMRSFVIYDMLQDYKETLDSIIQTQSQKNALILNIERQIKMLEYHNNDSEGMPTNSIETLKLWIDELKDKSLIGRLNEYLSRSIWSYGHTDADKQKSEEFICGICEEISLLPNKLEMVKKIISESKYDKEAMNCFAEHLALFDVALDFYEIIVYISENKYDSSFLKGYYSGVNKRYGLLPDILINIFDNIVEDNADFVLWASVVFDISDRGYNRIISLLSISSSIHCVENIKYGPWYNFLSSQKKIELCNCLAECNNVLKYLICFELFHGWMQQGEKNTLIYKLCIQIFKKCLEEEFRFDIYLINELFKMIPNEYEEQTIELMICLFNFNEMYNSRNYYINDYILSIKNNHNEKFIVKELGKRLILSNQSTKGHAMRGFFDKFALEVVKEWIEERPTERASLIAYHLDSPNLNRKELSPLTEYLLSVYEQDKEVYDNFILGEYNYVAYSPEEDYYNIKEEWFELIKEYENSPLVRIRQWADYEKKRIESICSDHRSYQAEKSRYE